MIYGIRYILIQYIDILYLGFGDKCNKNGIPKIHVKILILHSARICSYHKAILSLYQDKIQELTKKIDLKTVSLQHNTNSKLTVSVVDMDDTL